MFKLESEPWHEAQPHSVESLFPPDRTPSSLVTSADPVCDGLPNQRPEPSPLPGVQPPTQHLTQNVHRASQTFPVSNLIPHRPFTLVSPHPILLISANGYFILTFSLIKTLCHPQVLFPVFITNHQPTLHALPSEYTRSQPPRVTFSPSLFKEVTTMAALLSPSSPCTRFSSQLPEGAFRKPRSDPMPPLSMASHLRVKALTSACRSGSHTRLLTLSLRGSTVLPQALWTCRALHLGESSSGFPGAHSVTAVKSLFKSHHIKDTLPNHPIEKHFLSSLSFLVLHLTPYITYSFNVYRLLAHRWSLRFIKRGIVVGFLFHC